MPVNSKKQLLKKFKITTITTTSFKIKKNLMKKIFVLLFIVSTFSTFSWAKTELNIPVEYGTASYYGTKFHGRTTASGEIYNQFTLTAAHKTLPLGTIVKVTNAQNNKSVIVKINDRGPYIKGRVIDLSTKAAELLGYRNKGTAYVKIEIVKDEKEPEEISDESEIADENGIKEYDSTASVNAPNNAPLKKTATQAKSTENTPQPITNLNDNNLNGITNRSSYIVITKSNKNNSGFYGLQLGIFSDISVISLMLEQLEAKYKQNIITQEVEINGKVAYKVYVGKYQNRAYADALKLSMGNKYKEAQVVKFD